MKVVTMEDAKKPEKYEDVECDYCAKTFRTQRTTPTQYTVVGSIALQYSFCSDKCRDMHVKEMKAFTKER